MSHVRGWSLRSFAEVGSLYSLFHSLSPRTLAPATRMAMTTTRTEELAGTSRRAAAPAAAPRVARAARQVAAQVAARRQAAARATARWAAAPGRPRRAVAQA